MGDSSQRTADELREVVDEIRKEAGSRLAIMAHYYAPDEVVELADEVGDSLALAKKAAASTADAVLFCGVHFMLETADILMNAPEKLEARNGRRALVMAPDPTAGCPMADMIAFDQAIEWERQLATLVDVSEFTPITYVNSSAATKAFCGERDGAVCTSANAEKVVRDALRKRPKLLFMPDSRLGRTTCLALGFSHDEIAVWTPDVPLGGNEPEKLRRARAVLWDGYCPIHQKFSADVITEIRAKNPDAKFWVHPEAPREIVDLSDGYGSTTKLLQVVADAAPGSTLAIGTEWKLVDRIRRQNSDKTILYPGATPSVCEDMSKSTLEKVAVALRAWRDGEPINVVTTPDEIAASARKALASLL